MDIFSFKELSKKSKKELPDAPYVKVALLGDTATQVLSKAIVGYGRTCGINIELQEADYNQLDLQILNPASELYSSEPEFIVIFKSSQKLLKKYYKSDYEGKANFADTTISTLNQYIGTINQQINTKIILFNFTELPDMVFNNYGNKVPHSWIYQSRKLNYQLMELASNTDNVFIADIAAIQNRYGRVESFDPQIYIRTDIITSLKILPDVARSVMDIIQSARGKFKKCLILDLDNTTWGGIIGDDGIEHIQVGSLGLGKAFTELQSWAKNLKERGIILAICSKNEDKTAREPFEKHPDMVLRLDDIAVFVANWENKADNIRYIQSILNIGYDSMVFLDDNPFERNLVRQELPEVTVPELPKDPAEYVPYLQQFNLFETTSYSSLDKDRTGQYQREAKRVGLQKNFGSISEFLENLKMEAIAKSFDKFHVPRIAQLTQRSNQFNLRTIRYSEKEIKDIINSDQHSSLYVSLKDKFGDYGLISLVILNKEKEGLFIDTWIMSCRVLKRDVESFVLNEMVRIAKEEGVSYLIGERLPTKKNIIVKDHYKNLGFEERANKWYLAIDTYNNRENFITKKEISLSAI